MVSYDLAKEAIETTLRETGLGYVDLMLIHAPYGGKEGREGAWRAMVEGKKVCLCFSVLILIVFCAVLILSMDQQSTTY